ncbi:MAG: hypothetical protein Q9217_001687, partial [Psora testacea]
SSIPNLRPPTLRDVHNDLAFSTGLLLAGPFVNALQKIARAIRTRYLNYDEVLEITLGQPIENHQESDSLCLLSQPLESNKGFWDSFAAHARSEVEG